MHGHQRHIRRGRPFHSGSHVLARAGLSVALVALVAGCASPATKFLPDTPQVARIQFDRGRATLWSYAQKSAVIAAAPSTPVESDARPWFLLTVASYSDTPVTISPEKVTVTANGAQLPVLDFDALIAESKNREKWRNFGAGLAVGLASTDAGRGSSTTYGTTQGRLEMDSASSTAYATPQGQFIAGAESRAAASGRYSEQSTSTTTFTDPLAAELTRQRLSAESERMTNQIRSEATRERSALTDHYFRTQTLKKGKPYTGWILVDRPRRPSPENRYQISVRVGDEEHAFVFLETEVR